MEVIPMAGTIIDDLLSQRHDVTGNEKRLLARLLRYAHKTGEAWPKQAKLATDLGLGLATIKRLLVKLREKGLVEWKRGQYCAVYRFPDSSFRANSDSSNRAVQIAHSEPSHPYMGISELTNEVTRSAARTNRAPRKPPSQSRTAQNQNRRGPVPGSTEWITSELLKMRAQGRLA
jgi:DNA-binding transcriptional MocR family regulator